MRARARICSDSVKNAEKPEVSTNACLVINVSYLTSSVRELFGFANISSTVFYGYRFMYRVLQIQGLIKIPSIIDYLKIGFNNILIFS